VRLPRSILATAAMGILLVGLDGCGYHVAGRVNALPKTIHTIAVPAFENKTTSYRIEQRLTAATVHELLAKTRFRVVADPANSDAVLRGKVLSLEAVPILFDTDPVTNSVRATLLLVTVKCEVTLTETESKKVLFHTDNFLFRNEYQLSTDVATFFAEQDPALDRLAQEFATRLVASITEAY
jgi:outer membrane lipopolysaccharide assembly protein LptE/RlpB